MSLILDLQHFLGSTEFGSSRGAIHFHLLGYTASPADEAIDNASHEILEKAELRHLKSERELSLYHRIVNMTNQSFCHSAAVISAGGGSAGLAMAIISLTIPLVMAI